MPWLLSEDEALKKALTGLVVSDRAAATRRVPVYFSLPDVELREQSYPYITIDLIDIEEARERVHTGLTELTYVPEGYPDPETTVVVGTDEDGDPIYSGAPVSERPQPYDLTYQITTWARHPRHDRQILLQLLGDRTPARFGQVVADEGFTTHNSTVRRLDMLGVAKRDTLDGDRKRLFRNVLTVRMSSELFPSLVPELVSRATAIELVAAAVTEPEHKHFLSITSSGN